MQGSGNALTLRSHAVGSGDATRWLGDVEGQRVHLPGDLLEQGWERRRPGHRYLTIRAMQ